jgi:hypothetical protein
MRAAMDHRRSAARRLRPLMALLLLLVPDRGSAGPLVSPPVSPEEDAAFRSEWEKLRANQERAIRDNEKPLAEIRGPEGGAGAAARLEKITRDRIVAARAALKGSGKGPVLAQMAETASGSAGALAEVYRAQTEYVDGAMTERAAGAEAKQIQEATALLQTNMERARANLARATEAGDAMTLRLSQSGVLEKVAQIETTAKDAGARLAARWELERAARERDREQREREAGERARQQRR